MCDHLWAASRHASSHSPTVATVSQFCSACPALCGDDVLVGGSPAGAETLTSLVSSRAAGSFSVPADPAGGSMGRETHRATGAQRQPRHQQRQSTRVPAPTALKTMEATAVGLRAAGTRRTRVGSAGQTPMATLYIPGGSRLGGDRSTRAGGGGRDDAIGELSSPRSALPPTPSWEESGRGPALPVTLGVHGTRLYQSKIERGDCSGVPAQDPPPPQETRRKRRRNFRLPPADVPGRD